MQKETNNINEQNTNEASEKELITKRTLLQKRFYTALVLILTFAIFFCFSTFIFDNPLKLICGIISTILCISFFIVWAIKKSKIKKTFDTTKK